MNTTYRGEESKILAFFNLYGKGLIADSSVVRPGNVVTRTSHHQQIIIPWTCQTNFAKAAFNFFALLVPVFPSDHITNMQQHLGWHKDKNAKLWHFFPSKFITKTCKSISYNHNKWIYFFLYLGVCGRKKLHIFIFPIGLAQKTPSYSLGNDWHSGQLG